MANRYWNKVNLQLLSALTQKLLTISKLFKIGFDYLPLLLNSDISGHQTDHALYNNLDWWGKMNEKMDEKTKEYMRVCTVQSLPTTYFVLQKLVLLREWHETELYQL